MVRSSRDVIFLVFQQVGENWIFLLFQFRPWHSVPRNTHCDYHVSFYFTGLNEGQSCHFETKDEPNTTDEVSLWQ